MGFFYPNQIRYSWIGRFKDLFLEIDQNSDHFMDQFAPFDDNYKDLIVKHVTTASSVTESSYVLFPLVLA